MPAEIHGAMAVNALVASLEVLYGIFLISGAWTVVMQGDWNLATYFDGMSRNRLYVGHLVRRGAPPCIGLRFTRTALEFLYAGPDGTTRVGIRARYRFGAPMARMTLGGDGYWRLHSETFSPPHVPDNIVYTMLQDRDDNHIPADFFIYDVDPAIAKPPPQHFAFAGSLGFTEVRSDVIICVDDGVGNFKLWGSNSHMLQGFPRYAIIYLYGADDHLVSSYRLDMDVPPRGLGGLTMRDKRLDLAFPPGGVVKVAVVFGGPQHEAVSAQEALAVGSSAPPLLCADPARADRPSGRRSSRPHLKRRQQGPPRGLLFTASASAREIRVSRHLLCL